MARKTYNIVVKCPNCYQSKVLGLAQLNRAVHKAIGSGVHVVDHPQNILWELARVLEDIQKELAEMNQHEQ
jgi:hypothetical protein